ncbi:hypothetical protein Bbelb_228950 [Branchiostoma belcheri]|nr:hypothetical protein Bbelb_228950 [Branchiostoma belcheri]
MSVKKPSKKSVKKPELGHQTKAQGHQAEKPKAMKATTPKKTYKITTIEEVHELSEGSPCENISVERRHRPREVVLPILLARELAVGGEGPGKAVQHTPRHTAGKPEGASDRKTSCVLRDKF